MQQLGDGKRDLGRQIVGPREAEAGTVSPRRKGVGQLEVMTRQAFLERVQRESRERSQ